MGERIASGAVKEWGRARGELIDMGFETANEPFFFMRIGALEKSSSSTSDRKLRLIHDCRAINKHLDLSDMSFKLEQLVDFDDCLQPGDRLISTPLSSAYHPRWCLPRALAVSRLQSRRRHLRLLCPLRAERLGGHLLPIQRSRGEHSAKSLVWIHLGQHRLHRRLSASLSARMHREPTLSASLV